MEHAIFVPPDSLYSSLGPRTEEPDLSWQQSMQHVWDSELGPNMTQVLIGPPLYTGRFAQQHLPLALWPVKTKATSIHFCEVASIWGGIKLLS